MSTVFLNVHLHNPVRYVFGYIFIALFNTGRWEIIVRKCIANLLSHNTILQYILVFIYLIV